MRYLIRPFGIKGIDKLVYEAIYEKIYDFNNMLCAYTYRQIAEDIRLEFKIEYNPKQIMKAINSLVESGYLQVVEKGKKGTPTTFKIVKIEEVKGKQIDYTLTTDKEQINVEIPTNNNEEETDSKQIGNKLTTPYNKKKKKYINTYSQTSKEVELAEYFYKLILNNNSKAKKPNIQVWAKYIDYMIRLDNRTVEEIKLVMEFCQNDDFWSSNVLSTSKLRDKFDMLYMRANKKGPTAIGPTNKNNKVNSSICNYGSNYTSGREIL